MPNPRPAAPHSKPGFLMAAALLLIGFGIRFEAATATLTLPPGASGNGWGIRFEAGRAVWMEAGLGLAVLGGLAFLVTLWRSMDWVSVVREPVPARDPTGNI